MVKVAASVKLVSGLARVLGDSGAVRVRAAEPETPRARIRLAGFPVERHGTGEVPRNTFSDGEQVTQVIAASHILALAGLLEETGSPGEVL
jgi:hypothetical protein